MLKLVKPFLCNDRSSYSSQRAKKFNEILCKFRFATIRGASTEFLTKHSVKAAKITDRKLALIPICFILFRIWGTIRFLLYLSDPKKIGTFEKILLYLQVSLILVLYN